MAVATALLISFGHDEWIRYEEAIARAERDTRNAAGLLAQHTDRTFDSAEETLRAVARVRQDVDEGRVPHDSEIIHRILKAIHGGSPVFRSVGWIDKRGNRTVSSMFRDPPPLNVANEEQFRVHRDGSAPANQIYVAAPVRSKLLGTAIISASLRLQKADGSFDGIAGGVIDPEYFSQIYRSVELGPSRIVTLFRRDGTIVVREPKDGALVGQTLAGRPFITDTITRASAGTFHAYGLSDGAPRIVSYASVPDGNFIVTVAIARADALAGFRRDLVLSSARLGLIITALFTGAWLLVAQMRRRERLQAELHTSEAKFRDLAASGGDWFWETDERHRFVWMSDSVEAVTGIPAAWHYGKSRMEMAVPEGVPAETWAEHLRILGAHLPFRDFEYIRRGPAGDRWLRSNGVPIFDESGRFRGYRGSGSDVTNLRRAEHRLRDAVEAIPGGFLLFDGDDRLVYMNKNNAGVGPATAGLMRLGDSFETILRRIVAAGHAPEAMADPETWIAERLRRHRAAAGSTVVRNGEQMIEAIERPTHDGGVTVLRFDVTEREQLAQAQRAAREAADAANQAKSDFLSRMTHELRTPLNAIIGFAQLLQLNRTGNLQPDQREFSDYIAKSGQHLLNLVNEVLDLAGIEAGRLKLLAERVAVAEVVAHAIETMRPVAAKAGVELERLDRAVGAELRADVQRLRQVLLNLLSNAIKYNQPGGSVTVTIGLTDGGCVRISVTDTGIGVAAENAAKLFEPFQRLGAEHTVVEGVGIGLAISKRLIEAMNGRIGYASEPGSGSTFWVELPVASGITVPAKRPGFADEAPLAAAGGYSLIYVEDNPASLRLMEHLVATLPNVAMLAAPTGLIGLEMAAAHRPDVIVLDINLPGMSGFEILRRLQETPETRDIPVIALSAAAMPSDIKRGIAAGFFRYITKPLDVNLFLAAVDAALETRQRRATRAS